MEHLLGNLFLLICFEDQTSPLVPSFLRIRLTVSYPLADHLCGRPRLVILHVSVELDRKCEHQALQKKTTQKLQYDKDMKNNATSTNKQRMRRYSLHVSSMHIGE